MAEKTLKETVITMAEKTLKETVITMAEKLSNYQNHRQQSTACSARTAGGQADRWAGG